MPRFSMKSEGHLATCHEDLQRLFYAVVENFDCTILGGHRDKITQQRLFERGLSKVQYPNSKHNSRPSRAADVAPFPIDWNDMRRFDLFGGYVLGMAKSMGIGLRWGGDWNSNKEVRDNRFNDLIHFELT